MAKQKTFVIGGLFRGKTEEGVTVQYCGACGLQCTIHKDTLARAGICTILCFFCGLEQISEEKKPRIVITPASRALIEGKYGKDAVKDGMMKIKRIAMALKKGKEGLGG